MARAEGDYWATFRNPAVAASIRELEERMALRDEAERRKRRDWWDCALICGPSMDDAILLGEAESAAEYARLGETYARQALAAKRVPTNHFRPHTAAELRAAMNGVLHACSWYNAGQEDVNHLRETLAQLGPFAKSHLHLLNKELQRVRIRHAVVVALMAGDFELSRYLAGETARALKRELTTDTSVIYNQDLLLLLVATYLADPTGQRALREPVVRVLRAYLETWQKGHSAGLGNMELAFAIHISYLAAKYFDELRVAQFTREAVVRRLRYAER